jgi:hypothetical protein
MKRVLLIAFYFPPFHRSSGSLRVLKLTKYFPSFGIEPVILTATPRAYDKTDDHLLAQIPTGVAVHRAFAFDAKQHFSFRGAYFDFMALPDRYSSWIPAGIISGWRLIRQQQIVTIFSTTPIPSAHVIAYALQKLTKKPWIADFRDPIWDEYFQGSGRELRVRQWVESLAVRHATRVTVTTDGIRRLLLKRYSDSDPEKIIVVENGFDDSDFNGVLAPQRNGRKEIRLVHAGLLDPVDRDPLPFFQAVKKLLVKDRNLKSELRVDLIAPGDDGRYAKEIERLALGEVIHLRPALPYHQALREMAEADILLLFQGESCDLQIPAKGYEYLRIGRPILALTTTAGETGRLIQSTHAGEVVTIDDPEAICASLERWILQIKKGGHLPAADPAVAARYSRRSQTEKLAACMQALI